MSNWGDNSVLLNTPGRISLMFPLFFVPPKQGGGVRPPPKEYFWPRDIRPIHRNGLVVAPRLYTGDGQEVPEEEQSSPAELMRATPASLGLDKKDILGHYSDQVVLWTERHKMLTDRIQNALDDLCDLGAAAATKPPRGGVTIQLRNMEYYDMCRLASFKGLIKQNIVRCMYDCQSKLFNATVHPKIYCLRHVLPYSMISRRGTLPNTVSSCSNSDLSSTFRFFQAS